MQHFRIFSVSVKTKHYEKLPGGIAASAASLEAAIVIVSTRRLGRQEECLAHRPARVEDRQVGAGVGTKVAQLEGAGLGVHVGAVGHWWGKRVTGGLG